MDQSKNTVCCVIKCVKTKRMLKRKFASSVFHSCNAKTQKMQICITGPKCVNTTVFISSVNETATCFVHRAYKYSSVKTDLHASLIPVPDHTTGMSPPNINCNHFNICGIFCLMLILTNAAPERDRVCTQQATTPTHRTFWIKRNQFCVVMWLIHLSG
jgi:hypothetical protein